MKFRLALALAAGLLANQFPRAHAQESKPRHGWREPVKTQPVLVSGTEFVIVEVPVPRKAAEQPKQKMPMVVVIFAWIIAMFLWQLYFNRKQK